MNDHPNPLPAPGYTKHRGADSERKNMLIEAQSQCGANKIFGESPAQILIRIGVAPILGDRPLDDLAENAVRLTLDQARAFAAAILAQVVEAQHYMDKFGE